MEEIRVASWTDLQEQLFADSWHRELRRFRSDFAYRGRNDVAEDLRTSLLRLGGDARPLELHLLRNFRKYAQSEDVPFDSVWNWLALAQHHGLPTRLLDRTYSPYVAAHFATSRRELFDRDGVVWMVDYVQAQEAAPTQLRDVLDAQGMNVFTAELLDDAGAGLRELAELRDDDYVLFLEPPP